jgi:hypothetical protein
VGVVGRADESDPDEAAYRAVCAVAADHVVGPLGAAATGPGHLDLNSCVVLSQPDNLRAVDDFHAERRRALRKRCLGARLGNDKDIWKTAIGMPQAEPQRSPPYLWPNLWPHLGYLYALRNELFGLATHVEHFQRARVHPERPGEVRIVVAAFQNPTAHPGERKLARERQPGRTRTYHKNGRHGRSPFCTLRFGPLDLDSATPRRLAAHALPLYFLASPGRLAADRRRPPR